MTTPALSRPTEGRELASRAESVLVRFSELARVHPGAFAGFALSGLAIFVGLAVGWLLGAAPAWALPAQVLFVIGHVGVLATLTFTLGADPTVDD